jgi:hypothetical protein
MSTSQTEQIISSSGAVQVDVQEDETKRAPQNASSLVRHSTAMVGAQTSIDDRIINNCDMCRRPKILVCYIFTSNLVVVVRLLY